MLEGISLFQKMYIAWMARNTKLKIYHKTSPICFFVTLPV